MGKLCGAAVKTRGSMGKKRYNTRDGAGYSATLDEAEMAALNPRASGNGALLLNVSRRARGGARLCVYDSWLGTFNLIFQTKDVYWNIMCIMNLIWTIHPHKEFVVEKCIVFKVLVQTVPFCLPSKSFIPKNVLSFKYIVMLQTLITFCKILVFTKY